MLYDSNEALYLDLQNGRTDAIITNPMKAYLKFLSTDEGSDFELIGPELDEEEAQLIDMRLVWGGFTDYLLERGEPGDGLAIVAARRACAAALGELGATAAEYRRVTGQSRTQRDRLVCHQQVSGAGHEGSSEPC